MAQYSIRWSEHAIQTFEDLPRPTQKAIRKRTDELRVNPHTGTYDKGRDQWKAAFDGGLLMYTVGERMLLIDVLRVTAL
ncbi:type II toxin-antitoxin system RelE family toxin [Actinopolyspora sp. H202]|uniref:type II toxin-antitoxin system RelE family toxin n=1 Tax=Actinopolyspora sp. H202 TaxID=1500456 RepID=UPI003EE4310C